MSAVTILAQSLPFTGIVLEDTGAFTTLVAGGANGVQFEFDADYFLILRNTTGGDATFTLQLKTITDLSDYAITPTDPTVVVATGKTVLVKLSAALENTSQMVVVTCDVAAEALVMDNN